MHKGVRCGIVHPHLANTRIRPLMSGVLCAVCVFVGAKVVVKVKHPAHLVNIERQTSDGNTATEERMLEIEFQRENYF